ncbi:MAG: hypothetical protein LBO06_08620 [Bacteroidales bacterium]|jgi:hypothetical protein|nr:hypothetical protein [Bacteroidales bacterium]
MNRILCFLALNFLSFGLSAQAIKSEPLSKETEAQVQSIILANRLNKFIKSGNIEFGSFYIGNIFHFLSFNPIERTRLRLSGGMNLDNGLSANALVAWGTKDKSLKYSFSASYRFSAASNIQNTTTITHFDNTYLPYLASYDHILNSTGTDADFFLLRRKMYGITNSTNVLFNSSTLRIDANFSRNRIRKYLPEKEKEGVEPMKANFIYPSLQLTWSERTDNTEEQVIVSRYQRFDNFIALSFGGEFFVWDDDVSNRSRITLSGQKRIPFSDYRYGCLDLALDVGHISKDVSRGGLFYPQSQIGYVSHSYAFLVIPYSHFANTRFASAAIGLNSGGMMLNNIDFFRKFHGNEFLTFKSYLSDYEPYYEISFGVDNILDLLGFELAYSSLNKFGCFLRLRVSF